MPLTPARDPIMPLTLTEAPLSKTATLLTLQGLGTQGCLQLQLQLRSARQQLFLATPSIACNPLEPRQPSWATRTLKRPSRNPLATPSSPCDLPRPSEFAHNRRKPRDDSCPGYKPQDTPLDTPGPVDHLKTPPRSLYNKRRQFERFSLQATRMGDSHGIGRNAQTGFLQATIQCEVNPDI